eukprot:6519575-Prymnesium_polylepis.1
MFDLGRILEVHDCGSTNVCPRAAQSACIGGGYGDDVCAANHLGPLCQICLVGGQYFDEVEAICQDCGETRGYLAATTCAVFVWFVAVGLCIETRLRASMRENCMTLRRVAHQIRSFSHQIGLIANLNTRHSLLSRKSWPHPRLPTRSGSRQ